MKNNFKTLWGVILLLTLTICCGVMHNNGKIAYAEFSGLETSKSAILMDYDTKTIVYEKNKDQKLPIASMVKLMTIYITFKNIENNTLSLDQKITTSENASGMGGSQVFIDPYVSYSVSDLLKSVIMASANDASVALAEAISGTEASFVTIMNSTAKELGMNNTLYANCTGLPAPEQYSTAHDCAIILSEVMQFEDYHKFSNVWMDELVHPSGIKTELVNTNKLIRYFDGCDSGKTGSTSEAGYCLTASAKRDNMRLISVVIGAKTGKDRFKESTELLNYGFSNYQNKQIVNKETVVCSIKTNRCKQKEVNVVPSENYFAFDKKGNKTNYEVNYIVPEKIGMTKQGDKIGEIVISNAGNVVKIIDLTIDQTLEPMTFKDNFKQILENW